MDYFGFITLACIVQSIRFSIACYGCSVELLELQSGPNNSIKFEKDVYFALTDACETISNAYVTVDRSFARASMSLQIKSDSVALFTLKNKDLCKFLSDFNVIGLKCPYAETGRTLLQFGEKANLLAYGPFLPLFLGNYTLLLKICYDGDKHNPDVFKVVVNNKLKNNKRVLPK